MSQLNPQTIQKVARLARLKVDGDYARSLAQDMSKILSWIDQLQEVPTDHVEPLFNTMEMVAPLRDDAVTEGGCANKVLANAPDQSYGMFAVPKVVE